MSPGGAHHWAPYCGVAPIPEEWLTRWNLDPVLIAGLLAVAGWWVASNRRDPQRNRLFVAAFALSVFLFVSPFCALTSALFSARVAHHVALTALLAPLLAFLLPTNRLPRFRSVTAWTAIQALVFWAWHSPDLYAAALSSHAIYWLMQVSLLGSAVLFWAAVRQASPAAAVGALLATMVQMGLLGALITFAGSPLYAPHLMTTEPWGLATLQDQQLAGLIMWVPAAGLYLAAALLLARRWLKAEQQLAA